MITKIKEYVEHWQTILIVLSVLVAVVSGVIIYGNLPKRVDALEVEKEKDDRSVVSMTSDIQKYLAIQEEREKRQATVDDAQNKRDDLILEIAMEH